MVTNIPGQITALSAIGSIDRTADLLEIVDVSANTSFNVTVNNLLGISGSVLGTSDTQIVSNKALGNTNVITVLDSNFTLQDNGDNTKQAQFQLSGNTTGTTRVYSLPDATGTLMDLATAQTAANKIFTAPIINGGTLANVSLSANTITGFTTSNTGNIYGIAVTLGQITGANTIASGAIAAGAVGSTALATNAVQASQIATNAITLGYAQITSNFTTTSLTAVQATGLTVTVTIPSGGRKVKITVIPSGVFNTTTGDFITMSIWDGTVGSGTSLASTLVVSPTASYEYSAICMAIVTPSAGSKTYNVGFSAGTGGTGTLVAGTTNPAFILVEAI